MQGFQMSNQSWRKRSMSAADIPGELPVYNPASAIGRRETQSWNSRPAMKYKLVHFIPLVVILCFFILWCFSYPVELETKDGRTRFVPRSKKPPQESEATDVDLTVLALESPPDDFLSLPNGPYTSLALSNQPDVSSLDSHDHSALLTGSHESNASLSVSHELEAPFSVSHVPKASFSVHHEPGGSFSDSHEPNELFNDSHEPNASFSVSHDVRHLFPVSHEAKISYPGTRKETAPQASGEG